LELHPLCDPLQLRTGMKVCALTEKTGTMHYAGTIQRIETSRIRVNFERFSIAWRKVSPLCVLPPAAAAATAADVQAGFRVPLALSTVRTSPPHSAAAA